MMVPLTGAGTVLGAGVMQPFSYGALWDIAVFGGAASLSGTLLLAVPVICFLHSRKMTGYADYISTLLLWVLCICLLVSAATFFLTRNIVLIILIVFFFAIVWIPAWMACVVFWGLAVKEYQDSVRTLSKVMFCMAMLLWFFMSVSLGDFLAAD
ncbi:MAG: hypothetical protein HYS17_11430 [Micavibrio aeruginosavorus]|uniref:Yip1 domain-containing protein n=1 Tax=Micavibrio aeruginosavorus TaxID=349221 RepID=A0A7T5UH64_9BACT|nr:MAG: hypothetical protein HYS17_11430 [Micavibrio aeruginosavorus]